MEEGERKKMGRVQQPEIGKRGSVAHKKRSAGASLRTSGREGTGGAVGGGRNGG